MNIHLQPLGNGGCCGGLWWFCRHSWGYDQRQVRITWKLKTFLLFHISKMHCTYESFRTMLGKVDRLYFPKCTHHLFQKFSFQNAERHEAPSRTKKKVRFSLKFIHHPILKTLICATFEKRHIMEKLDSYLRKKRLSPSWQSTSSYPHTYHCYCCSKHLELRLHTSLRLIVWHVCDCYVFFLLFFKASVSQLQARDRRDGARIQGGGSQESFLRCWLGDWKVEIKVLI